VKWEPEKEIIFLDEKLYVGSTYVGGWMIKQRCQILEPNKMTVQNGNEKND
jgi:hypothetical protein